MNYTSRVQILFQSQLRRTTRLPIFWAFQDECSQSRFCLLLSMPYLYIYWFDNVAMHDTNRT